MKENTIYTDEMATSIVVTTTGYAAMTGSPYTPQKDGTLVAVELHGAPASALSIINDVEVRLTNPMWGVPLILELDAAGVFTAPANLPVTVITDCNLPVKTGSKITVEIKSRTVTGGAQLPTFSVIGHFS